MSICYVVRTVTLMSVVFPTLTRVLFLVPFDPKIPLFAFLSLLTINTHRILTEDKLVLQSDPLCGLPAAGGGCELDCDLHPRYPLVYSDPNCLRDCRVGKEEDQENVRTRQPQCLRQLYQEFEDKGRVVII